MRALLICTTVCFLLCAKAAAQGVEVETEVSTRETFVGVPVIVQVKINNAIDHDPPLLPHVDGLIISSVGPPSHSRRVTIINGKRTERLTSTYSFRVTPQREGTFTIPPVKVITGNYSTITSAVRIIASKTDTGDLMFVEIESEEQEIFVGEPLELTLKIWIRPFRDKDLRIQLDEGVTWNLISPQSNWGPFEDSLREMAENRRRPGGQSVLRKDAEGNEREYFLYEIDATIYPDRPGTIGADEVKVVAKYPVELSQTRSPFSAFEDDFFSGSSSLFGDSIFEGFGPRIAITKSRPIVGEPEIEPITVKPIPEDGQPADYRGAVGRYSIVTEATPTSVKEGDPITLHIGIDGDGPMDLVRAPPLANQRDLSQNFKVPDEELAGFVDQSRKVFTTTIRPQHEGVTEIPPIKFSFFDPDAEMFTTVQSDPIQIEVEKAETLALNAIVGAPRPSRRSAQNRPSPGSTIGIKSAPTLFAGQSVLQGTAQTPLVSSRLIIALAAAPALALLSLIFASRAAIGGLLSSRRRFIRAIGKASEPSDIATALQALLCTRFRLDEGRSARDQSLGQLRAAGRQDLAIRVERLYAKCDRPDFATTEEQSIESLREEATQIVDDLGRSRLNTLAGGKRVGQYSSSSAALIVAAIVIGTAQSSVAATPPIELDQQQKSILLGEALSTYASASYADNNEELYAKAADRFQLIVDSGVENDRLFYNLATAYRLAGDPGRAIAYYRRALRIDPINQAYRDQLALAQQSLPATSETSDGPLATARRMNDFVLQWVPASVMQGLFVSAWAVCWLIIAVRAFGIQFHWKSAAASTLLVAAIAAGSYFLRAEEFSRDGQAVLVTTDVSLREGDGDEFPEVARISEAEGRVVQLLVRRDDWLRIALDRDQTGWINDSAAVCVSVPTALR